MTNYRLKRIGNNQLFTVRFIAVAKYYGFKTVGKFEDMLVIKSQHNEKLSFRAGSRMKPAILLKEIEEFKSTL